MKANTHNNDYALNSEILVDTLELTDSDLAQVQGAGSGGPGYPDGAEEYNPYLENLQLQREYLWLQRERHILWLRRNWQLRQALLNQYYYNQGFEY